MKSTRHPEIPFEVTKPMKSPHPSASTTKTVIQSSISSRSLTYTKKTEAQIVTVASDTEQLGCCARSQAPDTSRHSREQLPVALF